MAIAENTRDIDSFVDDVARSHAEEIDIADGLLQEIVQRDQRATYAELCYFAKNLNWDERRVREELRRMHSVLRLQSIAGNPADREAAKQEADTSASVLSKEGPKIQAKIEELQAKLTSMERDARLSQKRVDEQAEAVKQLQSLAPEHIRESVNSAVSLLDNTLMRQILDDGVRLNELECCLAPSKYPTEAAYLESLQRSCREAVQQGLNGHMIRRQLSAQWPAIRASMEQELVELRERIATKQAEYDALLAPLVAKLDYYTTAQGIAQ